MERNKVISSLNDIIKDVLDLDDLTITEETVAADVEDWDSIMHVEIVVAIEQEFNVRFTTREIEQFKKVGDITSSLMEKV